MTSREQEEIHEIPHEAYPCRRCFDAVLGHDGIFQKVFSAYIQQMERKQNENIGRLVMVIEVPPAHRFCP